MEIIGLSGKLGVGKDYIALEIMRHSEVPTLIMALADHFKVDQIVKNSFLFEEVYHQKTDQSRKALQEYGTRIRKQYGADIWTKILLNWIRVYSERGIKRFIITDVRYPNEIEMLRGLGAKIYRIIAPERNREKLLQESKGDPIIMERLASHDSETALDNYTSWDKLIHNDSPKDE